MIFILLFKIGLQRYEAEPYAYASNIIGPENKRHGWANVTQVTGTASWMDVVGTQYLLGIKPTLTGLEIDPCIPNDWDSYSVSRILEVYYIKLQYLIQKIDLKVKQIYANEKLIDGTTIEPLKLSNEVNVKVIMG